jgi:hypothetical protein
MQLDATDVTKVYQEGITAGGATGPIHIGMLNWHEHEPSGPTRMKAST